MAKSIGISGVEYHPEETNATISTQEVKTITSKEMVRPEKQGQSSFLFYFLLGIIILGYVGFKLLNKKK